VGDWKAGMSEGFGEYLHSKDNIKYEGEWYKGEQHGYGKESYQDGSYYEGKL
jgi:hypothetical protein